MPGSDFRKPPTYEAIAKMKYLDNTVKELVRLWPTVMIYAVRPVRRHMLAGRWPVDPSQNVVVLLEGLHQDREFWGEDAGEFRPERWETPGFGRRQNMRISRGAAASARARAGCSLLTSSRWRSP